jgi:soluble lytic murein transglycosylase-like protein
VVYYFFANSQEKNTLPGRLVAGRLRPGPQPPRRLTTQELEPLIQEVSRYHNLPPSLIKAVIQVESNFNAAALSPKGAQGLMQLMPETADLLQVSNPYNIRENIWGGSRYLRMLLDKFNNRLPLALAAYNAGPQRVDQHREVPPIQETQHFVRDVCRNFLKYADGKPGGKKD